MDFENRAWLSAKPLRILLRILSFSTYLIKILLRRREKILVK